MTITLELPRPPTDLLQMPRLLTEAFALAEYNAGRISFGEVSALLNLDVYQTEDFLRLHQAMITRDPDDIGL